MQMSCQSFLSRTLVVAALAVAGVAHADRADRSQPMNIEADALRHDEAKQISTFTGKVVVTKGTLVLRGAKLEVRQTAPNQQFGVLQADGGQRAYFRQRRDGGNNEYIEGEAERIEYDSAAETVKLLGRAEIRRLTGTRVTDQISGAVVTYNHGTEVYTVDGGARSTTAPGASGVTTLPSGRVRAVIGARTADMPSPVDGKAPALRPSTQLEGPKP